MRFNNLALVISFCVGIVFMMFTTPKPKIVIKFPSPGGDNLFHKNDGSCYRVQAEHVECPVDRKNVLPQPVTDEDEVDPLMRYFV